MEVTENYTYHTPVFMNLAPCKISGVLKVYCLVVKTFNSLDPTISYCATTLAKACGPQWNNLALLGSQGLTLLFAELFTDFMY